MNATNGCWGLTVLSGAHRGRVLPALPLPFLIGRDRGCHLRPASDAVEPLHCVVEERAGRPVVRDPGSAAGTLVNGERVRGEYHLIDGDELRVGPLRFLVTVEEPIHLAPEDDDVLAALDRGDDPTEESQALGPHTVVMQITRGAAAAPGDPVLTDEFTTTQTDAE